MFYQENHVQHGSLARPALSTNTGLTTGSVQCLSKRRKGGLRCITNLITPFLAGREVFLPRVQVFLNNSFLFPWENSKGKRQDEGVSEV